MGVKAADRSGEQTSDSCTAGRSDDVVLSRLKAGLFADKLLNY
jgi:hypothetical protein